MSARVKIPIRLRVDPSALSGDRADLEDALAAALARALGKAREQVVEPRGGALPVRPIEPTFAWGGAAVAQVTAHARAETEAHVRRLIADALVESGVLSLPDGVDEVLPPSPSEVVQADRLRLGAYVMPSYGEDDDVLAAILRERSITNPDEYDFAWYIPNSDEELALLFANVLARELGSLPTSGYYGAILRGNLVGKTQRYFRFVVYDLAKCDFTHPDKVQPIASFDSVLQELAFDAKSHSFKNSRPELPTRGEYVLRRVWALDTADQRTDYITNAEGALIREKVIASPEFSIAVEANVAAAIKLRVEAIPADNTSVIEIVTPTNRHISVFRKSEVPGMPPLPLSMYPIVVAMAKGDVDKGKGDGDGGTGKKGGGGGNAGGTGKGKGKGAGGGGFHEGQGDSEEGDPGDGSGGYIVNPNATGTGGRFQFPGGAGASDEITCEPFEDEPKVDTWPHAEPMQRLIRIISQRLQIPICEYPGHFCITAARILGARASGVASAAVADEGYTAQLKPRDNFIVKPVPTVAVQFLRHLGGTVPYLSQLQAYFFDARGASWTLHFREEYAPTLRESIGWIFTFACQIAFLQQLRYSRVQIDARVAKLDHGYGAFFEETVLQLLTDTATLGLMREDLVSFLAGHLDSGDAVARGTVGAWRQLHRGADLQQELIDDTAAVPGATLAQPASWQEATDHVLNLAETADKPKPDPVAALQGPGTFAKKGVAWAIRDKDRRLWTLAELDMAVALQTNTAESVDPLVKQILDIDGIVPLFKANPWMIRPHLERLLQDMADKNDEITMKVAVDPLWAFQHGAINEDIANATVPYGKYALSGIHLNAHSLIYDAFNGDEEYAEGLNDLFDAEEGKREIIEGFMFAGILVLAVLCPEAAAIVGILQAAKEDADAEEMKDVYRALIDPDVVLSKAELEVRLFMGELMLAISIIPEAKSIVKGATGLAEAALKGTVKEFAKEAVEAVLKSILKQLSKNLIQAFVKEIVILEVFQALMEKLAVPLQKAIFETNSLPAGATPISGADLGLTTANDVLGEVDTIEQVTTEWPVGEDD